MNELVYRISQIPFWSKFADLHGMFAMLSLILFGVCLTLFFLSKSSRSAILWLKNSLFLLFMNILVLDIFGLLVYVPYRAEGGPRTILKQVESTAWLHNIIFEHKEFLAFAPLVLTFGAFFVVWQLSDSFVDDKNYFLKKGVLISIILSLIFVLTVAGEAVLVTKMAPV